MREVVSEHASGESLGFWEEFAQDRAISCRFKELTPPCSQGMARAGCAAALPPCAKISHKYLGMNDLNIPNKW